MLWHVHDLGLVKGRDEVKSGTAIRLGKRQGFWLGHRHDWTGSETGVY